MGEIVYVRAMIEDMLPSGQIGVKLMANNTDGFRRIYVYEKDIVRGSYIADQQSKIESLVDTIQKICADVRETHCGTDVCGLCEYDGAYIGESGDWCNECPGFDRDDCFRLKENFKQLYLGKTPEKTH